MFPSPKLPPKWLTVIIRDDAPMVMCNDSPTFRSVHIELTQEQRQQIALQCTAKQGATFLYEQISRCFIETTSDD